MGKLTSKGHYLNAAEKDVKYGSIIVVSSVASTYGGESKPGRGVIYKGNPRLRFPYYHITRLKPFDSDSDDHLSRLNC